MKKAIGFAMVLFLMTGLAQAQSFKQVKTADDFLAELKASMKDPDSFILEASYIKIWTPEVIAEEEKTLAVRPDLKKDKRSLAALDVWLEAHAGKTDFCFEYRAKNGYGGYDRSASLTEWTNSGVQQLQSDIFQHGCLAAGFTLVAAAKATAATAADKAKAAQQYADCLKLAVDNPKIVCKQ
ncbi:MAG: hypothetical protein WBQ43_02670 [Terriglobales bacterium]